jgi:hypothetical protein
VADLKKVKSGSPLVIPAQTFNSFIDAARDFQDRQRSIAQEAPRDRHDPGTVLVRNASGADQERFAVMVVSGVIIVPADNEAEFQNRPAFDMAAPSAGDTDRFVVLREPIADGEMGRSVITGVSPVQVDVLDESHTKAHAVAGETGHLESGSGLARILWKESGTGVVWAVVQFPVGGAGGGMKSAKITGKAGTIVPYIYTGVEVEHDGSSGFTPANFSEVSGGDDLAWKLVNAQEIGPGAAGVGPLEIDSIVLYTSAGSYFLCTASHYRGTY